MSILPEIPCAVAIRVLIEGLPVTGGVQCPLLLEGFGRDRRLCPVKSSSDLILQTIQTIVLIQFVISRQHTVLSPHAIGSAIVPVLNLSKRRAALLPQAVIDSTKPIEARVDVTGDGIIGRLIQCPVDPRLTRGHVHKA